MAWITNFLFGIQVIAWITDLCVNRLFVWYSGHSLNNRPFNYRTCLDHLNTGLVHYSDPTVFFLYFKKNLSFFACLHYSTFPFVCLFSLSCKKNWWILNLFFKLLHSILRKRITNLKLSLQGKTEKYVCLKCSIQKHIVI